jgi:hypothetical protein
MNAAEVSWAQSGFGKSLEARMVDLNVVENECFGVGG